MKSRGSVKTADMDSRAYAELGELMREYPEWKEQFPDINAELNPIRFTKNRANAPKLDNVRVNRRTGEPAKTDYQATYTHKAPRPRSSKRPPPSPRDLRPPPMQTTTIQKEEFRPKFDEYGGPPLPCKKEDTYESPNVKFDSKSGYTLDYPAKTLPPGERRGPAERTERRRPAGKFDDRTTNKEAFKTWKPERQVCYSELPSFTDSVLYPDQSRNLETTTATTFKGTLAPKPDPVRISSPNIRLEGDRDFDTVNRSTYKHHDGARPASMIVNKPELTAHARSKFDSKTMSSTDYGFKSHRPPKPCTPPKSTIDLKFNNKRSFSTEQRQQFPGIDVRTAPPVMSYKPDTNDYRPPSQKFETQTKHQLDYRPLDVTAVYQPPAKPPTTKQQRNLPKFVDTTTSKEFFRRWETEPRRQCGDMHEALQFVRSDVFVPTKEKFNTVSTTKDTYKGKTSEVPDPFIPVDHTVDQSGALDFNTTYRTTYEGPHMEKALTKSQAAKLLNELRKRKTGFVANAANAGHKPVVAKC